MRPQSVIRFDLQDSATWRQVRAKLQADIDRTKGINPPTAVRDCHLATVAAMKETLDATADFDQDALVVRNPREAARRLPK